jgi:uncharacterized membrane protein
VKALLNFAKTTIIGGFFIVLPAAILLFVIGKGVAVLVAAVAPIVEDMTIREIGGIGVATLLSILLLLALCFVTGLLVRTRLGRLAGGWVEGKILQRIPGYGMIRNLTQRFTGMDGTEFAPALVDLHGTGTRSPAFIVEEHEDGGYTIFMPLAPTPTIGQVHFVPRERVTRIDAPFGEAVNTFVRWGVGSGKLFPSPNRGNIPRGDTEEH